MRLTPAIAALLLGHLACASAALPEQALVEAGRRIYQEGMLPSGQPLVARREGGAPVIGPDAACILCHRRSGFGAAEGTNYAPPITGPSLFGEGQPVGQTQRLAPGVQRQELPNRARPPYTEAGLARALREGVSPIGHRFQYMMPRYELDDEALAVLAAYLRTLSAKPAPGAQARLAHFATVIAPDIDPARRKAMVEVLQACFREQYPEDFHDPQGKVKREDRLAWRLHVWQLEGAPETWEAQLDAHFRKQPVFALVSGLAGEHWAPVHAFAERMRLPSLFPNADLPGGAEDATYNFYLYKGVLLEAEALAQHLAGRAEALGIERVIQVRREGTAGAAAAEHLARLLPPGMRSEQRTPSGDAQALLAGAGAGDALVFWLREGDLERLVGASPQPPGAAALFVSGTLGGADKPPLNPAWKGPARILYAYDPPLRWRNRMTYNLRPWLQKQGLAPGDERLQGNTLTACNFLVTGVATLQGRWFPDLLLEAVEIGTEGNQAAPSSFPRFSLGPNQRFGAKGAFVVRFESPESERIVRDSDWLVP